MIKFFWPQKYLFTYKWTFIIDFPIAVAEKNVKNGIPKWPHVIPARSNKGLGTEAQINTVTNPYFYKLLYIIFFNLAMIPVSS